MARSVVVNIVGDASSLQRALGSAGSDMDRFGERAGRLGTKLTLGVTAPLALLGAGALRAGSDLQETLSKSEVVFGENAVAVQKWANNSAKAFGLSRQEAIEAASSFGGLFKQIGLAIPEAQEFSANLVQMSADLGSINNADPSQVLEDFRSGLAGQSEPLRKYNIFLNEAAVNAKAMELGLVDANGEITEGAKVQARYALIVEKAAYAQGDFARTADNVANKQRTATAEAKNAAAAFGESLQPAMEKVYAIGTKVLGFFTDLPGPVQTMLVILAGGAAAAGPILKAAEGFSKVAGGIGSVIEKIRKDKAGEAVAALINGLNGVDDSGKKATRSLSGLTVGLGAAGAALGIATLALGVHAQAQAQVNANIQTFIGLLEQEKQGTEKALERHILEQAALSGMGEKLTALNISLGEYATALAANDETFEAWLTHLEETGKVTDIDAEALRRLHEQIGTARQRLDTLNEGMANFDEKAQAAKASTDNLAAALRGFESVPIIGNLTRAGDGLGLVGKWAATQAQTVEMFGAGKGSFGSIISYIAGQGVDFTVNSTYRPGARTKSGAISYHALGKAVDFGGDMAAIYRALEPLALGGLLSELFYDPLGGIKNGQRIGAIGGHMDHVHAAVYDRGGVLPPGVSLAINRTSGNEVMHVHGPDIASGRPAQTVIINLTVHGAPGQSPTAVGMVAANQIRRHLAAGGRSL